MRLVSYNILDGGEGRADPIAEVIEAQQPDIVILIEADDPNVVDRIAYRLEMDCLRGQGRPHSTAVLSHWNVLESINHGLLNNRLTNCVLEATITQPNTMNWTLGAVHLHPHAREADESIRETEVAAILDIFARHRTARRPHLLAGDFNANSPGQR